MRKVKKKIFVNSKNKKNNHINENIIAIAFIFIGIFMTFSVRTSSMGIIGNSIKYLLLGLFSKLSILIAFVLIFLGVYKLIYPNKINFYNLPKFFIWLVSIFVTIVYGLIQIEYIPNSSLLSIENSKLVFVMAQRGEGSGLIASFIIYYLTKLLGVTGSMLLCAFLFIFILIYYFKTDPTKFFNIIKLIPQMIKDFFSSLVYSIKNFIFIEEEKEKKISKKTNKKNEDLEKIKIVKDNIKVNINSNSNKDLDFLNNKVSNVILENKKIISENNKEIRTSQNLYFYPNSNLLKTNDKSIKKDTINKAKNTKTLETTLLNFGVEAKVKSISQGPSITRYELEPKAGTKVSKITNLTEDLALALAAQTIRIEAPIPGKSLIGIEIPNEISEIVNFKDIIESNEFNNSTASIAFGLGMDIGGKVIVADIAKMPHILVAGATGSGKSVCINTLVCSILFKYSPEEIKMIMIDPKMVELSVYNDIPHLLIPVVTNMKKAPNALNWAVVEMNRRYKLFADFRVKDINGYNEKSNEYLPRILLIIDELADLMMVSPNEIEDAICRLAQMARACGIHLVIATQRPSVDVITGLIKANIPSRIAFSVSSQMDSRTILDTGGAEKLLGRGDMLYYPMGANKPVRLQGAFITEEEVISITDYIKSKNIVVQENTNIIEEIDKIQQDIDNPEDELLNEIIEFLREKEQASTSLIQRKFRIGYNRASRIIDYLESKKIVGASDGVKPRKVFLENLPEKNN